jgi:hypothetical protein
MSAVQRQRGYNEFLRRQGFDLVAVWVHRDDKAKLQQYVAKLRRPQGAAADLTFDFH